MSSNTNIFTKGGDDEGYSSISTPSGFNELKSAMGRDVQLNQMFGGKRRRKSAKKSKSRSKSRRGSRKSARSRRKIPKGFR